MNGLTNLVSAPNGANTLAGLIRDGGFGAAADNPQSLFSGGAATNNMLTTGSQLLGTIFGGRGAAVGDLLAKAGGVSPASANKILSLTTPLVLGVLGKKAAAQGLNSSGLANALLSEKSDIAAAAPPGLSKLLTAGPVAVPSATSAKSPEPASVQHWKETSTDTGIRGPMHLEHFPESAPGAAEPRRTGFGWLPLLLAGLAALGFLLFLRGRTPQPAPGARTTASEAATASKNAASNVPPSTAADIRVPKGSVAYTLALFLGDGTAAAPRTFVFDNLNFHAGTTQLTKPSLVTINDLVVVLKEYPNAKVQLVGHTDNTGRPEANQILSLNRANAVKNMLVKGGVAADRMSTAGMGQDHPVASNDTEDGRARNRRLELNVTSK